MPTSHQLTAAAVGIAAGLLVVGAASVLDAGTQRADVDLVARVGDDSRSPSSTSSTTPSSTSTTSTTSATSSTSLSPAASTVTALAAGPAGTVTVTVAAGALQVTDVRPAFGWTPTIDRATGAQVELTFRAPSGRVDVSAELEDGAVKHRIRVRDLATGAEARTFSDGRVEVRPADDRGPGRGSDDAPGDDHRGRGRGSDDAPGDDHRGRGRGSDDAPGDDRGRGRGSDDAPGDDHRGRGRGSDDAPGDDRGRGRDDD